MTEAETATSSAAAGCRLSVDTVLTADTAEHQDTSMATPVTSHMALVGVRNAIDASYVSCLRHLSRRVTQSTTVNIVPLVCSADRWAN